MKRKLCFLPLLCPFFWGFGQDTNISYTTNVLKIGDRVPDITIATIINYKVKTAKISDFRGKLLILDFWDTWCSNCINALPKLDSLQHTFGDSICILPVTRQGEKVIRKFLLQNSYLHGIKITTVTGDTVLGKIFPHTLLPHDVWIGPDGYVSAITDAQYINAPNIRAVLHGSKPAWTVKSDSIGFDENKPILGAAGRSGFYSALAPYKPGLPSVFGVKEDSVRHTVRTYVVNFPILKMYMMAWGRLLYFPPNRIFLEVKDTSRFIYDPTDTYRTDWNRLNSYTYESVLPATTPDSVRLAIMRQDLDRYLSLHGRLEQRKLKCFVLLLAGGDVSTFQTKGGKPLNTLNAASGPKQLRNAKLSNILWQMNQLPGSTPVVDETHYTGKVDMNLNVDSFADIPAVKAALAPYGLKLKQEERDLEVFVLTQPN